MPTSTFRQIVAVLDLVEDYALAADGAPRVLDVGCGWGRYGALIRDCWPAARIVGVDARPGQVRWRAAYDEMHYAHLPHTLPRLGSFDVVLLIDVIEHFDAADARRMLRLLRALGPVVVATPNGFMAQDCGPDDPETHRSGFTAETLQALGAVDVTVASCRRRHPAPNSAGQIVCRFPQEPSCN